MAQPDYICINVKYSKMSTHFQSNMLFYRSPLKRNKENTLTYSTNTLCNENYLKNCC